MDDNVGEDLPQIIEDERKTLQVVLSKDLIMLEQLESDLIKRRNSRKKSSNMANSTNNQRQSPSSSVFRNHSSRECANIIEEIKSTESCYVTKLEGHIAVFKCTIKNHKSQEIKQHSVEVSNNLSDLLQLQLKFANTLQSTSQLEEVLKLFYHYQELFQAYKDFFMKDQKFHTIQIEISTLKDEHIMDISMGAFLFQRLVQYKNLLEALQRATIGSDTTKLIAKTLEVITDILNECNKKLVLERINLGPINRNKNNSRPQTVLVGNCPLDYYNEYGTYYLENQFNEAGKTVNLHLFSKVILVTKKKNDQRIYQKHIKMTEVRLGPEKKNPKILVLEDFKKFKETGKLSVYEFEASFEEICTEWKRKIEEILHRQLHTWKSIRELETRHSK